jgi:hypothetical protein
MSLRTLVTLAIMSIGGVYAASNTAHLQPSFERVYELAPKEGVFAYSRISPDGRYLAYASQKDMTTQLVVDLETKQVLFSEPGIDAYFSNDSARMIFLAQGRPGGVTIRHQDGRIARNVAPGSLGDYFSWAVRDNRNLILTINSNFYYLDGDRAVLPHGRVPACEGIGVGERPLISKDGRRISTFVRGTVVVRGLTDCENTIDTGLQGAKADFSFDNRYLAFHVPKKAGARAYDIVVVDLEKKTMRTVTNLPGSSLFPSWTKDGRLSFRYDGDDYRGFMMASNVLSVPEHPLPTVPARMPEARRWTDVFPETPQPASRIAMVMVWATWSAHSPYALAELARAKTLLDASRADARVLTALEISSQRSDADALLASGGITLPEIPLAPNRLTLTEAVNQIPTTLIFRDGVLVDRRLGAQSADQLVQLAKNSLQR